VSVDLDEAGWQGNGPGPGPGPVSKSIPLPPVGFLVLQDERTLRSGSHSVLPKSCASQSRAFRLRQGMAKAIRAQRTAQETEPCSSAKVPSVHSSRIIEISNADCLKGRKRAKPSRNRLIRRSEVSHRGTILDLRYHQRSGEMVRWKKCKSYPRILFHP